MDMMIDNMSQTCRRVLYVPTKILAIIGGVAAVGLFYGIVISVAVVQETCKIITSWIPRRSEE